MSTLATSRSLRNARHVSRAFACMFAILAALFIGTGASRAAVGGVVDNGGFFSESAKSEASKVILELERALHEDIAVETFKEIPGDLKMGVNLQDKAALRHLFEQWADKQFRQKGVNGVYVLIVKEPSHLQVAVGNNTQRVAFTLKDRDALVTLMTAKLRAHQNDEALRDGVNFVSATMKSHAGNRNRPGTAPVPVASHPAKSSGGGMGWLIPAIIIGLVVWVVIGLIRAISSRASGGPAMGQTGGGGGGFMSSMIGGMFGAAAGMWMYDQFFSSHGSSSAYGSDRNDSNSGDGGFSGTDTDSTSSGGDFGSDSDSGSSGGGDFGGGDSGGGDSGGGGDF